MVRLACFLPTGLLRHGVWGLAWLLATAGATAFGADVRPNILWISCEDIGPHLGCYGCPRAVTPTLDRLARRGVRYTHAFTTCPVCATNRSSIITGMYPTTIGTHYMRCRARLPRQIRCFTEYLRQAGYYCSNNSKTDYNFAYPKSAWDACSRKASWRGRQPGQPFFAVRNFTNTHESRIWSRGAQHRRETKDLTADQRQDSKRVKLPPYYPDTPETRRDWANYFENITQLDHDVAALLAQLDRDGLTGDTIIFFWSDHGVGLPRAKRWLYDSGTRIPLLVIIPEKFRVADQGRPGTVSNRLICSLDFGPTVLNLAGVKIPAVMQGRAFLGRDLPAARKYVFGVRDRMDERYDMIRTVRDGRYRYIRNYMPWKPYAQYLQYAERNATMKALRRCSAAGTLPPAARLFMAPRKPVEELYDTEEDPNEIHNLADSSSPPHRAALTRLRRAHTQWITATRDLGFIPEPLVVAGERNLGNRFAILRQPDANGLIEQIEALLALDLDPARRYARCATALGARAPAVRYWAALQLADLARRATSGERIRSRCTTGLSSALRDPAPVVRMAAASGLCRLGKRTLGLPLLVDPLRHGGPWLRLQAAIALDELHASTPPATKALEQALHDRENRYVVWVAKHALHNQVAARSKHADSP